MSMKERMRAKFEAKQQEQAAESQAKREAVAAEVKELRRKRHNARRYDALQANARDVYQYDRDFVGDFSDEM